MATKIGRGVIKGRGIQLGLLLVTGGQPNRPIEWIEQTGHKQVLKQGRAELIKGDVVQVRDVEKFDRTVYIPIEVAGRGTFLIKREEEEEEPDNHDLEYEDMVQHSGQI